MQKAFIYGSCVTRDAEPWFNHSGLELAGYVARHSLISATHPAGARGYDFSRIKSAFQRRMTQGDVTSHLRTQIERNSPDLIVWDLCDERHGVRPAPGGGMVTSIRNHVKEGIHPGPFGPIIPFGTEEHFSLWKAELPVLLGMLNEIGLADSIFLNATPWAVFDDAGADLGDAPRQFNSAAERYIDAAGTAGVHVARVTQEAAVASTHHKWGPAPFHYVDDTYRAQLTEITALAQ